MYQHFLKNSFWLGIPLVPGHDEIVVFFCWLDPLTRIIKSNHLSFQGYPNQKQCVLTLPE